MSASWNARAGCEMVCVTSCSPREGVEEGVRVFVALRVGALERVGKGEGDGLVEVCALTESCAVGEGWVEAVDVLLSVWEAEAVGEEASVVVRVPLGKAEAEAVRVKHVDCVVDTVEEGEGRPQGRGRAAPFGCRMR